MIHSTHSKEKENAKSQKKVFYPFFPFTQGLLTYFSFLERCSLSQSDRLAYPSSKNVRGCGGEVYALCMLCAHVQGKKKLRDSYSFLPTFKSTSYYYHYYYYYGSGFRREDKKETGTQVNSSCYFFWYGVLHK